jgi:hypothetical protein
VVREAGGFAHGVLSKVGGVTAVPRVPNVDLRNMQVVCD